MFHVSSEVFHATSRSLLSQPLQINKELMKWSKDQFSAFIPCWQGNYRSQKNNRRAKKKIEIEKEAKE